MQTHSYDGQPTYVTLSAGLELRHPNLLVTVVHLWLNTIISWDI